MKGRKSSVISKHGSVKFIAERELQRKLLKSLLPDYEPGSATSLHNEGVQTDLLKDEVDDLSSEFQQWAPTTEIAESESSISDVSKSLFSEKEYDMSQDKNDESYVMPDFIGIKFSDRPRILLKDAKKKTTITIDSDNLDVDEIALKVTDWPVGQLYLSIGGYNVFPKHSSSLPDFLVVTTEQCLFSLDETMFHGTPQQTEREKAAWRHKERKERMAVKVSRSSIDRRESSLQDPTRRGSEQTYNFYSYKTDRKHSVEVASQTLVNISPSGVYEESPNITESALKKTAADILDKSTSSSIKQHDIPTKVLPTKYHINSESYDKPEHLSRERFSERNSVTGILKQSDYGDDSLTGSEVRTSYTVTEDSTTQKSSDFEKKKKKVLLVTPDEIDHENKPSPSTSVKQTHSSLKKNKSSLTMSEESEDSRCSSIHGKAIPFVNSPVTVYPIEEVITDREESTFEAPSYVLPEKSPITSKLQTTQQVETLNTLEHSTRSSSPEEELNYTEIARNGEAVAPDNLLARSPITSKLQTTQLVETLNTLEHSTRSSSPEEELNYTEIARNGEAVAPDNLLARSPTDSTPETIRMSDQSTRSPASSTPKTVSRQEIMNNEEYSMSSSRPGNQLNYTEFPRNELAIATDSLLSRSTASTNPKTMSKMEIMSNEEYSTSSSRSGNEPNYTELPRSDIVVAPDSLLSRRAKEHKGIQPSIQPLNINTNDSIDDRTALQSPSLRQNETLCPCLLPACVGDHRPPDTVCQRELQRERLLNPRSPLLEVQRELARPFANRYNSQRSSIVSDPNDILGNPSSKSSKK